MVLVETVLFDADGCLWVGPNTVPGAPECLAALQEAGLNVYVVTNNSNNTREEIAEKLRTRGFKNMTADNVISAGYVTAQYLLSLGFSDQSRRVFVLGETGLVKELRQNGINACGGDEFDDKLLIQDLTIDPAFCAVVAALDETLTYRKLAIGTRIVIENDAFLIGTNCDAADPLGRGIFVPDAMPTIMAIEGATGRKATILGKPTKFMFEPLRMQGLKSENTMMVGDRLNTDMMFAKTIGARGTVVLTGITTRDDAVNEMQNKPDYICDSSADVAELVKNINSEATNKR